MEVIVSAAVLLIVVLGVLAGLDSVTRTAASNQGRTVAATVAEKELERLRALRTADLNKLGTIETETKIVRVGDTRWEVTSKAQWVTDAEGEDISCALSGDRGSYLRITASVLPASKPPGVEPVVMSSIVAPQPGKGTLTALVSNATGDAVRGMPVQALGPSPATKPTNDAGCAVFNEAEAGSYKLRLDYAGWVGPDGNRLVEKTGTVSAGNLTTVEFLYDLAGSFPVSVVTRRYGATADVADRSDGVIASHTGVSTGIRAITATNTAFSFTSMFPFETPYEVYSGTCTDNNPAAWPGLEGYFTTVRGQTAVATVEPGVAGTVPHVVLEPAIDVLARYNGAAVTNARVYATPQTCAGASTLDFGPTDATGRIPVTNSYDGPGAPFGEYDVCVQYTRRVSGVNRTWRFRSTVSNTNPSGTSVTADFPATSESC